MEWTLSALSGGKPMKAASGATPSTQRMRPCTSGLTTTPQWAKPSPIGSAARWGMWSTRVTASSTSSTAKASKRSSRRTSTQRLELHMDGSEAKAFSQPDRELSVLIDAMLGEASCMGKSSECAFRCFYDPDKDVCGPAPFCQKVEESTSPSILAPFGQQQKCKAAGAEEKEAADLAVKAAAEDLKSMALGVTEELEAAPEISKSGASRSTMKKTLKLYEKASAILNVWQALPGRLSPETGNFVQAKQRVALTDMKHWRGRADRLTVSEYRAAAAQPAASLKTSTQYSVAAKLRLAATGWWRGAALGR
ncbi:unnamed protein product [Effrenium voratum]|nr:unnamed protein product [Effrenium voratum]